LVLESLEKKEHKQLELQIMQSINLGSFFFKFVFEIVSLRNILKKNLKDNEWKKSKWNGNTLLIWYVNWYCYWNQSFVTIDDGSWSICNGENNFNNLYLFL
jgi:hypothetical protein